MKILVCPYDGKGCERMWDEPLGNNPCDEIIAPIFLGKSHDTIIDKINMRNRCSRFKKI